MIVQFDEETLEMGEQFTQSLNKLRDPLAHISDEDLPQEEEANLFLKLTKLPILIMLIEKRLLARRAGKKR